MDQEAKNLRDRKSLKQFLLFGVGLSFLLEIALIVVNHFNDSYNSFFLVAIMWVPAIVAIVLAIRNYRRINMLGVSIGRATPILLGLFIPVVYTILSFFVSWAIFGDKTIGFKALAINLGQPAESLDLPFFYILSRVMVGILPVCANMFGVELGFRGFMYPVLERVAGRKKAVWISGGIFALWQLPLLIAGLGYYKIETPLWYGIIMVIIYMVLLGVILAWLRSVSDSILPPLFIHASNIIFGCRILHDLTTNSGVFYLAGETGVFTILLMGLTVFLGMKHWKKHDVKVEEKKLSK